MKKTVLVLAAALLTLGSAACSSKAKRTEAMNDTGTTSEATSLSRNGQPVVETGTTSGATTDTTTLGAPSSGRGH